MGKSVNKAIILGYVGKNPEIRTTAGGTVVANFSVATSDRQKDAHGEWQEQTTWHNLVCFKRIAEIVQDYVVKGSKVYVEGKISISSWEDKQSGQKRYKNEIIVNDIVLLSAKEDTGDRDEDSRPAQQKKTLPSQIDEDPDSIPF